ncbi:response regulator [Kordiimonas sediminis]|uniref:Response regulator n=1 Tax=Kordiimonas sediminis TaxID=1735581 RepID=A0A919E414_9PROT|nr:response regulator [Kordiimonas sediminis]GHF11692.1 response regulator [Kordiimonas sediminis]
MARILVVEDERAVRDFVARTLALHGHEVLAAQDGADALAMIQGRDVDLCLSDIAMPVMDGISLALKIKAERPTVPIILMTGYANEQQRAHNLASLFVGLIPKPFGMDQLLSAVSAALGSPISATASVQDTISQWGKQSRDINSSSD